VIHFTSSDKVHREFSVVLAALPVSTEPAISPESSEDRWTPPAGLDGYTTGRATRRRIDDSLRGGAPVAA
jgi:hypothetical protein